MQSLLPEYINTEEKQQKVTEEITARHFNRQGLSSKHTARQGLRSVTIEVELEGNTSVRFFRIRGWQARTSPAC